MTREERAAIDSVNPHFTFREKTAFLAGYRKGKRAASVETRRVADRWKAAVQRLQAAQREPGEEG